MKRVAIKDIADQLRLSRITVSKVINDKPGVSLETRKKVIRKLVECGYDKLNEKQLDLVEEHREEPSKCIAVVAIAPDFSEFWLKIINSISRALNETRYDFIYSILVQNEEKKYVLPKLIDPQHVSGAIVINVYDDPVIRSLIDLGVPTVFLDTTPNMFQQDPGGDLVLLDGTRSIFEITSHIISKGAAELGFIGDITYSKTILDRWEGFKKALAAHKIPMDPGLCFTSSSRCHFYEREEIVDILRDVTRLPQAFVCGNDFIAFMLIDYLKERGLRVPEDVLVSGYDNIREKITADSHLTTVQVDTEILGRRLVRQVLMRIETPGMPKEIIYIEPDIIYRRSTGD
jgi:LacI family transcriptional regulator